MPDPAQYYSVRRRRLLWEFDFVARYALSAAGHQFGEENGAARIVDARREFEALIPQLPYVGGR